MENNETNTQALRLRWWQKPLALMALLGAALNPAHAQVPPKPVEPALPLPDAPGSASSAEGDFAVPAQPRQKGLLFMTQQSNGGTFGLLVLPFGKAKWMTATAFNPDGVNSRGKKLENDTFISSSLRFPLHKRLAAGPAVTLFKGGADTWVAKPGVALHTIQGPAIIGGHLIFNPKNGKADSFSINTAVSMGEGGKYGAGYNMWAKTNGSVNLVEIYGARKIKGNLNLVIGGGRMPRRGENFLEMGFSYGGVPGLRFGKIR